MTDLNLSWAIAEDMFIPPDELEEFLGQLYDKMVQSERYKFIKEMYTREEYIETFSKDLTQDRSVKE